MIIYKITNLVTNKLYIGKTDETVEKRWKRHLIEAKHHDRRHLYRSINKYGPNKFTIEPIETCLFEDGSIREQYWIKYYNSMDRAVGYNLTEGGESGRKSEEYKRRISQTLKEYFKTHPHPPNPTKGKFGKLHHFYGKHHTNKTKQKLSDARQGKKYEDVMDVETSARLKEMHKSMWKSENNPSFKQLPMTEIINYIAEFPLTTATDISEKYNVSYPTVIDKFKQFTGMTFEKYKKQKFGFNHGIYKWLKSRVLTNPFG